MWFYVRKAPSIERWLRDIVKAIDDADVCVASGSVDHWVDSLRMAVESGGFSIWGWRQNTDFVVRIGVDGSVTFEVGDRSGALAKSFADRYVGSVSAEKPIVMIFYASGKGCIGAGFVLNLIVDYQTLFWKEELEKGRVVFPFRWLMRVFWLRNDVRSDLARGEIDPGRWRSEGSCFNVTPRTAVQCFSKSDIVNAIKMFLKGRVSEIIETLELFEKLAVSRPSVARLEGASRVASESIDVDPNRVVEEVRRELFIDGDTVRWIVFNLLNGYNLLLVGKPGVGKTALARLVAEKLHYKPYVVTANAHWSRFDVVGGIVLKGGKAIWRSGFLIRALVEHVKAQREGRRGVVLIIDEVNRADVDKAFGDFFTIFSGVNEGEWIIPESLVEDIKSFGEDIDEYAREFLELVATPDNRVDGGYRVPSGFRVICTMNYVDVRNLFVVGEAFARRFVRVLIEYPRDPDFVREEIRFLLRKAAKNIGLPEEEASRALEQHLGKIERAVLELRKREEVAFGPAHLLMVLETLLRWYRDSGAEAIDCKLVRRAIESVLSLSELWNEDVRKAVEEALEVLTPA